MLRRTFALASIAFALSMLTATDATAGGQRSFVSGSGADVGTCTPTAPCRSFGYAITQTSSGGEVIVLDSAGYGPVTITQSVSIIAPAGVYAGISVPLDGTGVSITGAGVNVLLRGLTINNTGGGVNAVGIHMSNGAALRIESCAISNFTAGFGALIQTAAAVKIVDSAFSDLYYGAVAGYGATVNIANSQFFRMGQEGAAIEGGASGTTDLAITDSQFTGVGAAVATHCIVNYASTGSTGYISATRVTVTNCGYGIDNHPSGTGTMTVSNSMVTRNSIGFLQSGGTFNSLGTSQVSGNSSDVSGTITLTGGK